MKEKLYKTLNIPEPKQQNLVIDYTIRQMSRVLLETMGARDTYLRGHSESVAQLAINVGIELGLSAVDTGNLWLAGTVHDIGKIGIAAEILNKPGPLSKYERQLVETHVEISVKIVEQSLFPSDIVPIVAQHHERLNGSGYPRHLKGDEIVLGARILAVADVFDAMKSSRPYRSAFSEEAVISHLSQQAGILYDPAMVDALIKVIERQTVRKVGVSALETKTPGFGENTFPVVFTHSHV